MLMAMEPFSLVDFPGRIAAVIFFGGCNFHCGYCQNPALVKAVPSSGSAGFLEILGFLRTREGLLDGVCFTGGEPLLSPEMPDLVKMVKELGFRVKLDTNGSSLEKLKEAAPFLDYIALDIKSTPEKYDRITGCHNSWEMVAATMAWLKTSGIPHEFRTTVLPAWHSPEDLPAIRILLGAKETWVLQQFREPPGGVLDGKKYEAYPDSWLADTGIRLGCKVRGINLP